MTLRSEMTWIIEYGKIVNVSDEFDLSTTKDV